MSQAKIEFLEYLRGLRRHISAIDYRLSELPKGYIHHRTRDGRTEYCLRIYTPHGRKEQYLNIGEVAFYQNALITRKFLKKERKITAEFLKEYDSKTNPLYIQLRREVEEIQSNYMDVPSISENKNYRPEEFRYYTQRGERVRSQGEKIIADTLHSLFIDYAYERAITWSEEKIYPHFTIEKSARGQTLYWEYWGNLCRPGVPEQYLARKKQLEALDIYEGRNLIVTLDADGNPDETDILKTAKKQLLFDWRQC